MSPGQAGGEPGGSRRGQGGSEGLPELLSPRWLRARPCGGAGGCCAPKATLLHHKTDKELTSAQAPPSSYQPLRTLGPGLGPLGALQSGLRGRARARGSFTLPSGKPNPAGEAVGAHMPRRARCWAKIDIKSTGVPPWPAAPQLKGPGKKRRLRAVERAGCWNASPHASPLQPWGLIPRSPQPSARTARVQATQGNALHSSGPGV